MDYPLPRNVLFQGLQVAVCRDCGFGTVPERIDPERLQNYYRCEYAGHAERGLMPLPVKYFSDTAEMFKPQRSLSQLRLANRHLTKAPDRILDLGAGFGTTLYLARRDFWPEAELIAVEPDSTMGEYLATAGCRQISDLNDAVPASYDLIIASHVLEHYQADDIGRVLARIRSLLAPSGMLLAEVPNSDFSVYQEIAGHSHEPHLLFFSQRAFGSLLENHGFHIRFLESVGSLRRRSVSSRLAAYARRLTRRPAAEYGGDRTALRLLAQPG